MKTRLNRIVSKGGEILTVLDQIVSKRVKFKPFWIVSYRYRYDPIQYDFFDDFIGKYTI